MSAAKDLISLVHLAESVKQIALTILLPRAVSASTDFSGLKVTAKSAILLARHAVGQVQINVEHAQMVLQ